MAKPQGLISFVYHLLYDPEVNAQFVQGPQRNVINTFNVGGIGNEINNAGTGAGPSADSNLPAIKAALFIEIREKFQNRLAAPADVQTVAAAKPKGLISFVYNVIYDPTFRNIFTGNRRREMEFFLGLDSGLRDQVSRLWDFTGTAAELRSLRLDLVWARLNEEIDENYLLTW